MLNSIAEFIESYIGIHGNIHPTVCPTCLPRGNLTAAFKPRVEGQSPVPILILSFKAGTTTTDPAKAAAADGERCRHGALFSKLFGTRIRDTTLLLLTIGEMMRHDRSKVRP